MPFFLILVVDENPPTLCGLHQPNGLSLAGKDEDIVSQEGEWPHVCLLYRFVDGRPEFSAGASLIAAGILVTSAHKIR